MELVSLKFYFLIAICFQFIRLSTPNCSGNVNLPSGFGRIDFEEELQGRVRGCSWTFLPPTDEDSVFIIRFYTNRRKRRLFSGLTYRDFQTSLIFPGGPDDIISQRQLRNLETSECRRYVHSGSFKNSCTNAYLNIYCNGLTYTVNQWPPVIRVSPETPDNSFFDLTVFYVAVSCPTKTISTVPTTISTTPVACQTETAFPTQQTTTTTRIIAKKDLALTQKPKNYTSGFPVFMNYTRFIPSTTAKVDKSGYNYESPGSGSRSDSGNETIRPKLQSEVNLEEFSFNHSLCSFLVPSLAALSSSLLIALLIVIALSDYKIRRIKRVKTISMSDGTPLERNKQSSSESQAYLQPIQGGTNIQNHPPLSQPWTIKKQTTDTQYEEIV